MRDIERIDPLLEKLAKVWKQHPDMRLGQLIENAVLLGQLDEQDFKRRDVWNAEENIIDQGLDRLGNR